MGKPLKKVFIKTFGCQMNVYDSGRMADIMAGLGYGKTDNPEDADVIIINTCHIREKASDKVFSEVGRYVPLKKQNPNLIIVVAGCVVQAFADEFLARAKGVDIALGPQCYHLLGQKLREVGKQRGIRVVEADFPLESKFDSLPEHTDCAAVSFLAIQEGCDRFCSYCVVPYTRGAEYSRPFADVMAEARDMVAKGAREIVLLGQNVNAWHGEDEEGKPSSLDKLIYALAKIEGLERIRFVTSYPSDMTDELIEAFGKEPKLMPYLHLPIQSGSDKVLKAMNRRYTVQEYNKIIEKLRAVRPDIAISSDFIVGFAGEDENDFNNTLKLVDKVKFASSFSFKYSPRAGTVGAAMRGQVPEDVKGARLIVLQAKLQEHQLSFNQACLGREMEVLIEGKGNKAGEFVGHSPYMQTVVVPSEEDIVGRIVKVKITKAALNNLVGEAV